ncbi:AraC family transcriptional regulator [Streptomyces lasiicapitis]|uniref:AraC family transcriptional regulator n=1 Tax=Streptomyces lasiicapitis TaxID=1923961 RepID=UPI003332183D
MDVVSDAISAVRVGSPSANRVRASGSWCTRLSAYEGAGFHVVLSGNCRLLLDEGRRPVELSAGDVVLLPHGSEHVLADAAAEGDVAGRAVLFERWLDAEPPRGTGTAPVEFMCGKYRLDRARAHPLLTELPDVIHLPARPDRHPELHAAVGLLARETEAGDPVAGADIAVPSLLDLLLVYMIRAWMTDHAADATPGWPCALGDPVVATALRLLHSDPAHPWTNDGLAARTGVSRATLARKFTALVGRPPMAYLGWWRMTRAAALLRAGEASLTTIARHVGYGSPYALSHAFNREFGTTPGRYRKHADAPGTAP